MPDHSDNLTATKAQPQSITLPYMPHRPRRRRWQAVRDFFRPDRLREFGTTLALVIPLTLLIWIWAEREQTVLTPTKWQFFVTLQSSNLTKSISLEPGRGDSVGVELTGPKAQIEALKDATLKDRSKSRLVVDIGDPFEPGGPYQLPIDTLLNQQKLFSDYGVTVLSTEPSALQVYVDRQVERDLPIRTPQELQGVVSATTTTPQTVKVRGPEKVIKQLEADGKLFAELDLSAGPELRSAAPGAKVTFSQVPLKPLGVPGVSFDANSIATVSLQRSQEEQGEIKSVIVYVSKPASLESHIAVTTNPPFLTGVKVIGPRDVLQKLARDEIEPKPIALVVITREDQGKRGTRTPIFLNLPPGVRVVEGSVPPVQFEVIESAAAQDTRLIP